MFKTHLSVRVFPLLSFAFLATLSGCFSNGDGTSNLSTTEDDAVKTMETRLKDSARVNQMISRLDLALRPISNVLSDVEKILKAGEKDQLQGEINEIRNLSISVIRRELDRLKRGLIEKNADGNWTVSETMKWPFTRLGIASLNALSCDASEVSLIGRHDGADSENVSLTLKDCALADTTTLVSASVSSDMKISAQLNLGGLDQLVKSGGSKGPCLIESSANTGTRMSCDAFAEMTGNLYFEFESLAYSNSVAGETMDFAIKISKVSDGTFKPLAHANIHQGVTDSKPKVDIARL